MPRERFEMVSLTRQYWDPRARPTIDRVVLLPLPDAETRHGGRSCPARSTGSFRRLAPDADPAHRVGGQRDLLRTPSPTSGRGSSPLPKDSPWLDLRVRHAANLCVNREESLQVLLGGYMGIPKGSVGPPGHPWWGEPSVDIPLRPDAARALMEEAGYSADNPIQVKVQTSASGSGQMQPVTMNEISSRVWPNASSTSNWT